MRVKIVSAAVEITEDDVIAILTAPKEKQVEAFRNAVEGKAVLPESVSDYDIPHLRTAAIDILGRRELAKLGVPVPAAKED